MIYAQLKAFVEHTPAAVAMLDRDLCYIMTSNRWLEDYQLQGQDIIGKKHYDVLPHVKERWKEVHQQCLKGHVEKKDEDQIQLPSGQIEWIKWEMHPWKDKEGKINGIIIVREDITERKKAEDKIAKYNQELESKVNERTEALEELSLQLRSLSKHLQNNLEKERTMIAREIHDELGQVLTALKMDLQWLTKRLDDANEPAQNKIDNMVELIDATISSVQRICTELRPGILDDLGLIPAIEWQLKKFETRSGLNCRLEINQDEELQIDKDITTNVFRILQEALTNILRHAQAENVWIQCKVTHKEVELNVEDDGKGLTDKNPKRTNSFGLIGMRERVNALNGRFDIEGKENKGTKITAWIPLKRERVEI